MANPPITRFTSLAVSTAQNSGNPNNGLYAPELTQDQIKLIPTATKKNGGIWYNKSTKHLEAIVDDVVEIVQVGPSGQGDVIGPNKSVKGNIAIFSDTTGKAIDDSGVDIAQVPSLLAFLKSSDSFADPNVTVNEIGNLGHVKFINDVGLIFVDSLMPVEFITNSFGGDEQVCSLFTGGLPSSSTSPSALVELQSDSGALLLSRMTTDDRDNNLSTPSGANGMLLFNTTSKTFDGFDGTNWRPIPQLNTNGTLTAADPVSSANLATKNYVDTSISVSNPTRIIDNKNNFFIGTNAGNLTLTLSPNTGVGINTLASLTNGHSNVSVGYNSQTVTTSGTSNTSVGRESLFQNVKGHNNCAFGTKSLYTNTASNNVAVGSNALFSNTTGTPNSAFGTEALFNNTTGINNNAFGYLALNSNTTGDTNNAFGNNALFSNTTGFINSAFGHHALFNNTTGIINNAFGNNALFSNTTGALNSAFGHNALALNTTGTLNSTFGHNALFNNTTGNNNNALGSFALFSNTTGSKNAAFSTESLYNNLSGTGNSSFGDQSLRANIIGSYNCAFGAESLTSNLAEGNCGFGYRSLYFNVNGINNTAVGALALFSITGNNNTGIGTYALSSSSGTNNTAVGAYSSYAGTSGSHNVFIGYYAGGQYQQYDKCIFIGESADTASNTGRINAIAIGYQATVGADNCMVLGGSGSNQIKVGIGITPNAYLQFHTAHDPRKIVLYETANNDHQVYGFGTSSGLFNFQIDNTTSGFTWKAAASSSTSTELMRLTGGGLLSVGGLSNVAQIVATGGVQNTVGEGSCIRAISALGVTKIEVQNINGTARLWEIRSLASGVFDLTYRTGLITPLSIDTAGITYTTHTSATYYGTASTNTIVSVASTFVKLSWPAAVSSTLANYTYATSRLTYTGPANPKQLLNITITAGHNGATVGEIATFAIYKNGAPIATTRDTITAITSTPQTIFSVKTVVLTIESSIIINDYFEIYVTNSVARTITVTDFSFSISST